MKNLLENVDRELAFYIHEGKEVYNVGQLREEAEIMSDEVFNHHVNDERNDFANWIRDVFENKALATKIESLREKEKFIKVLDEAISKPVTKKPAAKKTK